MRCPLCLSSAMALFQSEPFRRCPKCAFIAKDEALRLLPDEEEKRYLSHNNSIEDEGYLNFLKPAIDAVSALVSPGGSGLDFGSGPTRVLAELLDQKGFCASHYDPYFSPHLPEGPFDFLTCTEAAEHFYVPAQEFAVMRARLAPRGHLILMTEFFTEETKLESWYYARDPTHVSFYSAESIAFIAQSWNADFEIKSRRLATLSLR